MKKRIVICFIFSILLTLIHACVSDEESQRQGNSAFKGAWTGTFSGNYSGTLDFTVSKEGNIEGTLFFSPGNHSEIFLGYVNGNGKFDFSTKSNFQFSGFLNGQKTVTGIWNKTNSGSSDSGSFSINKK